MTAQTILPANSVSDTVFNSNSCRFDGTNAYMSKTPGSNGDAQKFTTSIWFKRGLLAGDIRWFEMGDIMLYSGTNIIGFANRGFDFDVYTDSHFLMDLAAWYHVVWAVDTTQSTAANRVKIYVNGVLLTASNGLNGSTSYMDQNANLECNQQEIHRVGAAADDAAHKFDGYMSEFVHIDGAQLAPTSFGESDSDSEIWKPIDVSGLTFGTNGFYLDFKNSANLGNDANGGTDLTETGLSAFDQSTDTPTNNFCTLNPITKRPAANGTIAEGNLQYTAATGDSSIFGTIAIPPGMKVYFEVKLVNNVAQNAIGIHNEYDRNGAFHKAGNETGGFSFKPRGAASVTQFANNGTVSNHSINNVANGTIIGVAVDNANGQIHYSIAGTYINSSDPTDNDPVALVTGFGGASEQYLHFSLDTSGGATENINQFNFGSPPYSESGGNSDANGHGNFNQAVPSGYFALNTKNLAEHG